jgi:uncharacterized protein (TIGR02246 family)
VSPEAVVASLYSRLIEGWNAQDADAMAAAMAADGLVIGFDGSQMDGRDQVANELGAVFADHETAAYVTKVRSTTALGPEAALLHAVAGMVAPGRSEIVPDRNAIQTVVASKRDGEWAVALFQTTPAQFHGRPELAEALAQELAAEVVPAAR